MKSRIAAIVYPLYAGIGGRRLGRKSLSRLMACNFDERRMNSCCQALGFERFTHSSAVEDDGFTELGPEISECYVEKIKLATEKPGHYEISNRPRKGLVDQPSSSDSSSGIKGILSAIAKTSKSSSSKTSGLGIASTPITDPEKISKAKASPSSVSIKNVPSTVDLSQLDQVVSKFGEVSGASFAPDGIKSSNVVNTDEDSDRKAISTGNVSVKGQVLSKQSTENCVSVFEVRIKNINRVTSDYAIHSKCMSVGELVGLSRTSDDVVDAFFNVRNEKMKQKIISRLSNTKVDIKRWSACPIPENSTSSEECSSEGATDLVIFDHFSQLREQMELKKLHLQDLEHLNASIIHLQEMLSSIDPSPNN